MDKILSTKNTEYLSDREKRLLYCSLDACITADIWEKIQIKLKKEDIKNPMMRYNQVMGVLKKSLSFTYNLKLDKSLCKKQHEILSNQISFDAQYKRVLIDRDIIKKSVKFDVNDLNKLFHKTKVSEIKELCRLLIRDIEIKKNISTLDSLMRNASIYQNFGDFEFNIRSNTIRLAVSDISIFSNIIKDKKLKVVDFEDKVFEKLDLNPSEPLLKNWINGDGPIVASRTNPQEVKEIKSIYLNFEDKYSNIKEKINECYLQSYEKGWVTSPFTGNSFMCPSDIDEKKLMKTLLNDVQLEQQIEFINQLENDKIFLINQGKIIHES